MMSKQDKKLAPTPPPPQIRFKRDDGSDFPDWEERRLRDILEYEQPTKYIVDSSKYDDNYSIPVLTAGKTFILGYTNETYGVFTNHPVIIFDDFTTVSKFVDFDFKVKSSAMKILKLRKNIQANIKLVYECMQKINFSLKGHKRYWISEYQNITIPFPTLPEQQKIASFLQSVDTKIQLLERKVTLLQSYKKGVIQKLFSQELRFKDEQGNEYPDWEEREIGEIFYVTRGIVLSKKDISPIQTSHYVYPVFSSQTKNKGLMGYYHKCLFENCITWTTDGANAGDVNYRKGKFYCTNVCGVLKSDKGYANTCIAEILNATTKRFVSYVGNPKLMNNIMSSIRIKIPVSIKEQQKIGSFLQSLDTKISLTQKQVVLTKQYKKGLLQRMFV